jgi:hypothetical protein
VLKALAIVLTRVLPVSPRCTHVKGNVSAKAAVRQVSAALPANRFVFRTDVRSCRSLRRSWCGDSFVRSIRGDKRQGSRTGLAGAEQSCATCRVVRAARSAASFQHGEHEEPQSTTEGFRRQIAAGHP